MKVYTTDILRGYALEKRWINALSEKLLVMCRRAGFCDFTAKLVFSKHASLEPWVARYRVNPNGHMQEGLRHDDVGHRTAQCYSFVLVLEQNNTMLTLFDDVFDFVGKSFQLKPGDLIVFDSRRLHQMQIAPNRSGSDSRLICTGTFTLQ